jgi:A118 family predicted phage portal protein
MFETIKNFLKGMINKMFNKSTLEKATNVDIAMSTDMINAIPLWTSIYEDNAPWVDNKTIFSANIGAAIASELARLVTIEFKSEISNNDFLNKEYQVVIDNIRNYTEFAAAKGGLVFKPYVSNGHIEVDMVQADAFYPTKYNSRSEITGAIFLETKTEGDNTYTRVEYHDLDEGTKVYTIRNFAFVKKNYNNIKLSMDNSLGDPISLESIDGWEGITPEVTIQNIEKPLFSYFKMPMANTIDSSSPLGVSCFSRIAKEKGRGCLLEEIDIRYSQIKWEYEAKEAAIDVSVDLLKAKKDDNGNVVDWGMAKGKERLFRPLEIYSESDKASGYNIYSPEIRDSSLFTGFNELLRQAEFQAGLAYGTLSKEVETAKTATEIKTSKQRSYQTVSDIQKALRIALEGLIYAMSTLGILYKLPVKPVNLEGDNSEASFDFDDSIIIDHEAEIASMQTDVSLGILDKVYYIMKKYKVDEAKAKKMIPQETIVKPDPFASTQE